MLSMSSARIAIRSACTVSRCAWLSVPACSVLRTGSAQAIQAFAESDGNVDPFAPKEVEITLAYDFKLAVPSLLQLAPGVTIPAPMGGGRAFRLRHADLFTVRFRVRETFVMPPHWHPKDERVTVISGSVGVAFGADAERQDATEFGPGDYYVNARNAVHQVWIEGPTVIQITGIGPWQAVPAQGAAPPG